MMGILFVPPIPDLSEDLIPAFDAVKSQYQEVMDPVPFPDSTTQQDTAWQPTPPTSPPKLKDWADVQKAWNTPNLGVGAGALAVTGWAKAMGWGEGLVEGEVPVRLVGMLPDEYVEAPLLGTPGAA